MALISEFLCFCEPNLTQLQTIWWCFGFSINTFLSSTFTTGHTRRMPCSRLVCPYTTNDFSRVCFRTFTLFHTCHTLRPLCEKKYSARKWEAMKKRASLSKWILEICTSASQDDLMIIKLSTRRTNTSFSWRGSVSSGYRHRSSCTESQNIHTLRFEEKLLTN